MSWFEKIMPSRIKTERRTRSVPEGLWIKCPACDAVLYRAELERNLYVCPKCGHHMRMGARDRLERFLDAGTSAEIGAAISPEDPLKFRDSKRDRKSTRLNSSHSQISYAVFCLKKKKQLGSNESTLLPTTTLSRPPQ